VFVVFREEPRGDHLVEVTPHPAANGPGAIEILGMQEHAVTARVSRPGTFRLASARGRRGELVVDAVPAPVAVMGPWQLAFPDGRGAPAATTLDELVDWTRHPDPGIRHFSGTAVYRTRFTPATPARAGKIH
jgi:hypothetical protein